MSRRATSYTLSTSTAIDPGTGYREAAGPSVATLVDRLTKAGYRLEVRGLRSTGEPADPIPLTTPLLGPALHLRIAGAAGPGLALRLGPLGGQGELEVLDEEDAADAELGTFTLVALGEILRTVTFRPTFSSLSPESTETLRPTIEERPRRRPQPRWVSRALRLTGMVAVALALASGGIAWLLQPQPEAMTPAQETEAQELPAQIRRRVAALERERDDALERARLVAVTRGDAPCPVAVDDDGRSGMTSARRYLANLEVPITELDRLRDRKEPRLRIKVATILDDLRRRAEPDLSEDVALVVEREQPPILIGETSFRGGSLHGQALVWSYRQHRVICAALIDVKNSLEVKALITTEAGGHPVSGTAQDSQWLYHLRHDLDEQVRAQIRAARAVPAIPPAAR